jgi:hypothetical protein
MFDQSTGKACSLLSATTVKGEANVLGFVPQIPIPKCGEK